LSAHENDFTKPRLRNRDFQNEKYSAPKQT
jgi:hypothetical protein